MRHAIPALAAGALAIASGWDAAPAASARLEGVAVRYVTNAGMLVTVGEAQFLIDAPTRDGIPPYPTSPADERRRLEGARPPYDQVDAILITHWHEDHFSAAAAAAHLSSNADAQFVSSPEVVDRVRTVAPELAPRLRPVLPPPGQAEVVRIAGVPVRVLRIRHNPTRRLPEQHVGFLIGETPAVLHVGDADPVAENFTVLRDLPEVDVALLPFWYVASDSSRRFVTASIGPRQVVAMHMPPGDANRVAAAARDAGMKIVLPPSPGSVITLER